MEAKGEEEEACAQKTAAEDFALEKTSPGENLYAFVKSCVINGSATPYSVNAFLDLNSNYTTTKYLESVTKPRCNSMN